jgi:hypothetical protein
MAFQFSTAARNAALDAIETAAGTAPVLTIRTGTVPANCAAARTGAVLATLTLPSDWLAAASGGTKGLAGTWSDLTADAGGTAGYFSVDQGATCHIQGTVTATSGGGDLQLDNVTIVAGGAVTITAFTLAAGGA